MLHIIYISLFFNDQQQLFFGSSSGSTGRTGLSLFWLIVFGHPVFGSVIDSGSYGFVSW